MHSRKNSHHGDDDDAMSIEMAPIMITKSEDDLEIDASDVELERISAKYHRRRNGDGRTLRFIAIISAMTILLCISAFSIVNSSRHSKQRHQMTPTVPTHEAFGLMRSKYLPTHQAMVHVYKHRKTQAEFMAYVPKDETQDKVFGISFRTKPKSNNGVAHILEHSVLSGSRKYPAKDPFLILMKGSLNTFLNAMTYNDRTVYPVASRNKKDFMNLMSVYLDAVFAPKCVTDEGDWVLKQEGWRYEVDDDGDLELQGVVYSEMQGVFSNPLSMLGRDTDRLLFPDNTYHFDSGGEPLSIPNLTQAEFVDFYKKHYHPTNSQSFVSGTVEDIMDALDVINTYMMEYEYDAAVKKNSEIEFQKKRLSHHLYQNRPYPVQKLDSTQGQHMLTITWLLNDEHFNPKVELGLYVLDYLLLGTSSSPMDKRLSESGIGSSIIGGGLSTGLLQSTFAVGMKGVKGEDITKLEELIIQILKDVVKNGFSDDDIEAAMNSIEFQVSLPVFNRVSFLLVFVSPRHSNLLVARSAF